MICPPILAAKIVAFKPVGPGWELGVTLLDGDDAAPGPAALDAVTVYVYGVPLVNPVTKIGLDVPVNVAGLVAGVGVTVYKVIGLPLAEAPLKVTVAWVFPPTAVTVVGGKGGPYGITLFDAADARLIPLLLVAVTLNVYDVPLTNEGTVIGEHATPAQVPVIPPGDEVAV